MNEPVRIFEYKQIKFCDLSTQVRDLLSNSDFVDGFERFLKRAKLDRALTIGRNHISVANYVGVLKYKQLQIEILPSKLSANEAYSEHILKNLLYMLSYTKRLEIQDTKFAKLFNGKNPFMETLIHIYASRLSDALKCFSPKDYVHRCENSRFCRGKFNLGQHLKYNSVDKSRIFCEFDDFSEDNPLNQLFLYVAKCLYCISHDNNNKKLLKFIIGHYLDVTLRAFNVVDLHKIKLNKNQNGFTVPLILAKMFLERSSIDMTKNKFENIALLWDMNILFEEFVFEFIQRNKSDIGIHEVCYQKGRRLLRTESNQTRCNTYVDIFIRRTPNDAGVIVDTKYKNRDCLANADVFQVSTYAQLHGANVAVLLYPMDKVSNTLVKRSYLNVIDSENPPQINTAVIDLTGDLKKSREGLVEHLKAIMASC